METSLLEAELSTNLSKLTDTLIPGLGPTCTDFLNNNMHGIIESIVHEDLDPEEVCTNFGLCP